MFSLRKTAAVIAASVGMLTTPVVALQADAAPAKPHQECYQKFTGANSAAFAMWFRMKTKRGAASEWTDDPAYPVGQSRTIDLGEYEFAEGTYFQFEGAAALGKRFYSGFFQYCKNDHTQTLYARGTTLNNWWSGS